MKRAPKRRRWRKPGHGMIGLRSEVARMFVTGYSVQGIARLYSVDYSEVERALRAVLARGRRLADK